MKHANTGELLPKIIKWGIAGILIIAPFYAPITVFLASRLQHFDLLRIWKEIALTGLGLAILFFLLTHLKESAKIVRERLFQLVAAYTLLLIGIAIYDTFTDRVAVPAVIYGLMIHLRLGTFFMVVYLAFKTEQLNKKFVWWKFVMIPAAFVVGFGLLQMTILPDNALEYVGYSSQTIVPFHTVDNNPEFVRIQSTLRGPNPLGAYLLVIISLTVVFVLSGRQARYRKWLIAFLCASLIVLFGTYSRSAFIGIIIALLMVGLLQLRIPERTTMKKLGLIVAFVVLLAGGATYSFRNTDIVQTTLLHNSKETLSIENSNSQRAKAIKRAVVDVIQNPLGQGIGSAGPASLRNTKGPDKISENFYLQLAQEAGWLGLVMFAIINFVIGIRLYRLRTTALATALLASLVGLTFINMLSHAWSDDTLAYLWWGLAGIALAHTASQPDIIDKKRKYYGKAQKTTSKRT